MPAEPPPQLLILKTRTTEDETIVECCGRLSADFTPVLKTHVRELLSPGRRVALDMSSLNYIDSSGLGAVVGLYVSARNARCELHFVNLSKPVREMFRLTNLLMLFEPCGHHLMKFP